MEDPGTRFTKGGVLWFSDNGLANLVRTATVAWNQSLSLSTDMGRVCAKKFNQETLNGHGGAQIASPVVGNAWDCRSGLVGKARALRRRRQ